MTRTVTVYSGPTCAPCAVAKKRLDAAGVPYSEVDLSEDAETLEALKRRFEVDKINTPLIQYGSEFHQIDGLSAVIAQYKEANHG